MTYEIGVIPGDGIGPEVIDAVLPLVERVADDLGSGIRTESNDWAASATWRRAR